MFKNKIYQYFFLEFTKIFLLISLSLAILIWMTQAARFLELVTEYGNPIEIYLKYIFLIFPKILDNVFLLSFTIAMFFLFAKLENANELGIYWLSGISKVKLVKLSLIISCFTIIIYLFLSSIIAPRASFEGRKVLSNSKFSFVNSLVKENNFNAPLKNLMIYVSENDQKGNLKNIFIYEKERTIIAKRGKVLSSQNGSYLELNDGATYETNNKNINVISFESTVFDFSKYSMQNTTYPKYNERSVFWLFKNLKNKNIKSKEIREEINKRLIQPFYILILCALSCFLLYSNPEKINLKKLKISLYITSIFLIIINQIILGLSGENFQYTIYYIFFIFSLFLLLMFILKKLIKSETK